MYILNFIANNHTRELGRFETTKECMIKIDKFLEEHSYKSYYRRTWGTDEGLMIDVGSHTEFFCIKNI